MRALEILQLVQPFLSYVISEDNLGLVLCLLYICNECVHVSMCQQSVYVGVTDVVQISNHDSICEQIWSCHTVHMLIPAIFFTVSLILRKSKTRDQTLTQKNVMISISVNCLENIKSHMKTQSCTIPSPSPNQEITLYHQLYTALSLCTYFPRPSLSLKSIMQPL
jgi:hypothetical protein